MPARTFLGTPCKKGHDGLRYLSNGACVHCTREKRKADVIEAREQAADDGNPKRDYRRKVIVEVKYAPEVRKVGQRKVRSDKGKGSQGKVKKTVDPKKVIDPLDDL